MHNNGIIHQCNLCPQLWCEGNYCGNVPLTLQIDVRSRRKHRVMQFQSGKACIIHGFACKKAAAKHFKYTHLRLLLNAIILPLNQQPITTHEKSCRALLRKGKGSLVQKTQVTTTMMIRTMDVTMENCF